MEHVHSVSANHNDRCACLHEHVLGEGLRPWASSRTPPGDASYAAEVLKETNRAERVATGIAIASKFHGRGLGDDGRIVQASVEVERHVLFGLEVLRRVPICPSSPNFELRTGAKGA